MPRKNHSNTVIPRIAAKSPRQPSNFVNSRGQRTQLTSISATDAKNEFARALEMALRGPVIITKHENPKAVLLSIEAFQALSQPPDTKLNSLSAEFDALLDSMQTRKAVAAMKDAFAASPAELSRVARRAARRRA